MSSSAAFQRNPLIISGNSLASGGRSTTFPTGGSNSLLRGYLIFVRDMRGQRRKPSIELRTDDISVIAHHLGVADEFVVGGLLDLMGATRAQRHTMMAMLAAGALTVVLTGSFVSDLSTDGISVDMVLLADAVQAAVTGSESEASPSVTTSSHAATGATATTAVRTAATTAAPTAAPTAATSAATTAATSAAMSTSTASGTAAVNPEAIESVGTAAGASAAEPLLAERTLVTPNPDVLRSGATAGLASSQQATEPVESAGGQASPEPVGSVAQEPVSIGIAPDGALVASVAPPVPASPAEPVATAELPDGTIVGVAAPPVPPPSPAEPVATAELPDGTIVGVAAPPVPPPSGD